MNDINIYIYFMAAALLGVSLVWNLGLCAELRRKGNYLRSANYDKDNLEFKNAYLTSELRSARDKIKKGLDTLVVTGQRLREARDLADELGGNLNETREKLIKCRQFAGGYYSHLEKVNTFLEDHAAWLGKRQYGIPDELKAAAIELRGALGLNINTGGTEGNAEGDTFTIGGIIPRTRKVA